MHKGNPIEVHPHLLICFVRLFLTYTQMFNQSKNAAFLPDVSFLAFECKVQRHSEEERHAECGGAPTVIKLNSLACSNAVASV